MNRIATVALALIGALQSAAFAQPNSQSDDLDRRSMERRAVEAVIWGMPAVNTDLMLQAALGAGAKENEIIYWSRPVTWKNQTLTPNPDAIYLMTFFNTKDGPVVIEVPPAEDGRSITGNIDDFWQTPLEDAGPSGADQGKGGRYLILPPGYAGQVPEGYVALPSLTNRGYALMRSNLPSHSDADIARSVEYGKRLKVYPLAAAANPPPTRFTDAAGILFDSTIPYDGRFFEALDRVVQNEPWLERDRAMIDQLRSVGIEKGKPFRPDPETASILTKAVAEAHAWLDHRYETIFPPYWDTSRWAVPALEEHIKAASGGYADPDSYPVDARAVTYTLGYVGIKRLGAGQFYLLSSEDRDGNGLQGGHTYKLHVPPDAPVELYWSATAYDRETHALIKNMERASRGSNATEIQKNADGSVDVWFGPTAPAGKASDWVPTDPERDFEVLFRLYAPTKPLFDKTWVLPDLKKQAG